MSRCTVGDPVLHFALDAAYVLFVEQSIKCEVCTVRVLRKIKVAITVYTDFDQIHYEMATLQ